MNTKKTNHAKLKASIFLMTSFIIGISILGCTSNPSEQGTGTGTGTQTSTSSQNANITEDVYLSKLEYYEQTISTLQSEILDLKQNAYISTYEHELLLENLQKELDDLKAFYEEQNNNDNNEETNKPTKPTSPVNPDDVVHEDNFSIDNYEYTIKDNSVTITKYTGDELMVIIPSKIAGMAVTHIGQSAFSGCSAGSITIPSSVTEIGWFAFSGSLNLQSVYIPPSVKLIEYGAFDGCDRELILRCVKGSYADLYGGSFGMEVMYQ